MRNLIRHIIVLFRLPLILGIALLNIMIPRPVVLAQTGQSSFKNIRTVSTAEFGVSHPTGFAFLPTSREFLLWGTQSGTQEVQLISDYKDPSGSLILPVAAENPLTAAFDSQSNSLFMLNHSIGELVKVGIDQNGLLDSSGKNTFRYNTRAFGVESPQGIAFDPASGHLFILDSKGPRIVSIAPHPTKGFDGDLASSEKRINQLDLSGFGNTQFRGLAFNPQNDHLYVGSHSEKKIYEFAESGEIISFLDLGSLQLNNIQAITFAPSADLTDDPATMNLFVLDGGAANAPGQEQQNGQILELSLQPQALPSGTTLLPSTLIRTFSTSNSVWNPSSPDPSGIDYWPLTGRLLISDSEVDEMPNYFTGKNVFDTTLSGTLVSTCSTTNLSRTGFSNEPSGLAINPNNNRIYFADDDQKSIFEVSLGPDNTYCTSDDTVTSVNLGLQDVDDVAYGNNMLFIAAGIDAEVYMFSLGPNGVLGGGDDGPITHFDTAALGFSDLEGIGYNADQNTLFIVSTSGSDQYLGETTLSGTLLRAHDLGFMGTAFNLRSDVAYAPSSQYPNIKNIYIVSRGVDNDNNPNENDGMVWEISLVPPPTPTPAVNGPFLASFASNGTVGGVSFADEDILRFDGSNWSLFFDGSDVGVGSPDLFAFSIVDTDTILMSFSANVTVNGVTATPQDVLRFDATSLGTNTAGTFSMYFDGSDVGFDTTAESIDALSLLEDGRLLISTTGNPTVAGVTGGRDEDVLAFRPTSLGNNTSGSWAMYFDGSDVGLADTSDEDVDALDVVGANIYLSTLGNFAVPGLSGADEDVFVCVASSIGEVTACNYSSFLYFDGSAWGLSANDLDAFDFLSVGAVPTSTPTYTPTVTSTSTPTPTLGPSPTPTNTPTITPTTTVTSTPTPSNTPTPTNTVNVSDVIFADGFESGNLFAWTSSSTDGGDLGVSPSAALRGSQGLQALIDDVNAIYVTDDTPNAEPRYRARFYFDPNSLTMANGDAHILFRGFSGTSTIVTRIEFGFAAGGYQIKAAVLNDSSTWSETNWFSITDAPHAIELDWRAASGAGANNGGLTLWIDGVQQADLTGIDNDTWRLDRARLGAVAGLDAGTSGTYYFDAFESRRQTYIGP